VAIDYTNAMPIATDGSVHNHEGRLLYCSADRFVAHVGEGDHCFICDRTEREIAFNREHVLPNWLLHQFGLHGKSVTLPNRVLHSYGTYRIPCCIDCNTRLSKHFETPISEAFAHGLASIQALVEREGPERLFHWMALIFLKMHLKDRRLYKHLDRREGDARISETYDWATFHHIHCMVRAHYSGAEIGDYVLGSVLMIQVDPDAGDEPFDLASVTDGFTLYLRAGDVALYAVFNDAQACVGAIEPVLDGITGMLNPLQARELAAELAAANMHLGNRPTFHTLMSDEDGADLQIVARLPVGGPVFADKNHDLVGFVKHFLLQHATGNVEGRSREESCDLLRQNKLSFLFDNDGRFISDGRVPSSDAGSLVANTARFGKRDAIGSEAVLPVPETDMDRPGAGVGLNGRAPESGA